MEQEMYSIPLWQHASDMAALDKAAYKSLFLYSFVLRFETF